MIAINPDGREIADPDEVRGLRERASVESEHRVALRTGRNRDDHMRGLGDVVGKARVGHVG
jgi:hypothetical protein